ncbi:MAG: FG-GAP-like repeat-containing protein [Phycisphaerales bacterium]
MRRRCTALAASATALATPPAFSNQAVAAGVNVSHSTSGFTNVGYSGGACVGDFNNDGFQDLYFISGGGGNKPDYLFINNGDGTFSNQAAAWGINVAHKGKSASVADFNGDGWLDLYVTSAGPTGQPAAVGHHKLYRNNGDGTFTNIAATAGVAITNPTTPDTWGTCWGDFDHDGDLDLFVAGFSSSGAGNPGNRLFRNNGDETFTDITAAIGLFNGVGAIAAFSPRMVDTDGDRWPELMIVGDFKGVGFIGSRYFRNNAGASFTDVTVSSHVGQEENGMGHTVGDFNNDQRLDWYTSSIYLPSASWTGNKLYKNVSAHNFTQYATPAGVFQGGYGWGTVATDFNHDGWTDIAETNGDTSSGPPFGNDPSHMWMNNGNDTFTDMATAAGFIHTGPGRCLITFDYDNDGDMDIVLCTYGGPLSLFRNDLDHGQPDTHWLRVFLNTQGRPTLAPNGYGAKVLVKSGPLTLMRSIDGGCTFLGICELSAHFGLGTNTVIDELKVEWPDGTDTVLANIAADQTITVSPALPCGADLSGDGLVDGADLGAMLAQWGGAGTADLNGDGVVDGSDLGVLLAAWGGCA